uniref:Uncharacterized protein n=1 Tax=Phlebotomus papatasi TaxID=29031 RepID=A0A1B0D0N0_PHLPP
MISISHQQHHADSEDDHTSMTLKGLVAVLGIVFFFATERGLTMIAEWRKQRQKKEKPPSRVRVMRDPESASLNNATGEKLCKHKYSSYPYCYDEIAMETKDDHHHHHNNYEKPGSPSSQKVAHSRKHNSILPFGRHQPEQQHQEALMQNYSISSALSENHKEPNSEKADVSEEISQSVDDTVVKSEPRHEHSYTVILREHESQHHGAAFSNNIAGGFSTAIAVFCHELPHELGDFAVLLKAGMSARQAVYYNLLSSVLSFLGMVLGVLVGDTPEASAWIFAVAAGMFLCAVSTCLLQVCGMLMGLCIMLLIALYENDLKSIFTADHAHNHPFNYHHDHQH